MTSTPDEGAFAGDGELLAPQWSYKFLDCSQIDAGEMIAPAHLDSELACRFAALHLVFDDLSFALDCLTEADKLGVPSSTNLVLRSLIFSGAAAYARCFKDGVRPVRLSPDDFDAVGVAFSV